MGGASSGVPQAPGGSSSPIGKSIFGSGLDNTWARFTGKYAPTAPQLPAGFEWMGPMFQQLASAGAGSIPGLAGLGNQGISGMSGLMGSINPTVGGLGFLGGAGNALEGASTGFLPDIMSAVQGQLMPGIDRQFERGAAGIRENAALTGNLSSTGALREINDYRSGLDAAALDKIAGIYGSAVPAAIGARGGMSSLLTSLPNQLASLFGPMSGLPLQLMTAASGGVSGAPFYANQGSSGNGALGAAAGSYLGGKGGKGGG